jgi:hypothetical protein
MTTRRSEDLQPPREAEAPLLANVRPFPLILGPHVILEMAQPQRERETKKAVARHARRKRLRSSGRPTHRERGRKAEGAGA